MDYNDEFLDIEWDADSEQPYPIRHKRGIWTRVRYCLGDYLKSVSTFLLFCPLVLFYQTALSAGHRPSRWSQPARSIREFAGLAVCLHSCDERRLASEIEELGVKHVLLRIPLWELEELDRYVAFMDSLPECEFVVCLMQTRRDVIDPEHWRRNLNTVVRACWPRVKDFQIGQGVNRSKWGFFSTGEFLSFASVAEELRAEYEGIRLIGPCILDFETIPLLRGILHGHPIRWDAVGCALYVDRRGSPRNRQLLFFNLKQKILHFAACIRFANKAERRFWITEVNWPIKDQGSFSPTCERDCVSEEDAARYLREYYEDAWDGQLVERVYWWQLVAKGFGLIDVEDDGTLRRRPGFYEFKQMLEEGVRKESEISLAELSEDLV